MPVKPELPVLASLSPLLRSGYSAAGPAKPKGVEARENT
jgi:hypothetical protein